MPTTVAMVMGASLISGGGIWVMNREHYDAFLSRMSTLSPRIENTIEKGDDKISNVVRAVHRRGDRHGVTEDVQSWIPGSDKGDHHMLLFSVVCAATALLLVFVGFWLRKRLTATAKLGKGELTLTFTKIYGVPKGDQDPMHAPKVNVSCTMEHESKTNKIKAATIHFERDTLSADLGKDALVALNVDFDGVGVARRSELTIEVDVELKSGEPIVVARQSVDCAKFYAKTAYTDTSLGPIKLAAIRPNGGFLGCLFAKPVLLEVTVAWKPRKAP